MPEPTRAQATVIGPHRVKLRGGALAHPDSGRALEIDTTPRLVGRSNCDMRVDDLRVSAAHCELVATERGVRVRDLTSRNGTFIDGVRVVEVLLTKPATLRIGDTFLAFTPGPATPHLLPSHFGALESQAPCMQAVFARLNPLSRTSINIHLAGESGSGKTYIARKIHEQSKRARHPFLTINIAEIPPTMIESILFGHEKGAFTGATGKLLSPFALAHLGTVFIDEIAELPFHLQSKLLRVMDEKVFLSVGGTREQRVDVRIISASLYNLQERVNRKEFREDLFYRLGPRVEIPPLRDRREDILLLTKQILTDMNRPELFETIPESTQDWMMSRSWEGNLRGIKDVLRMAIDLMDGDRGFDIEGAFATHRGVTGARASGTATSGRTTSLPSATPVETLIHDGAASIDVERAARGMLLRKLHAECEGVVSEIARRAKLSRKVVRAELASLGVRVPAKAWKRRGRKGSE